MNPDGDMQAGMRVAARDQAGEHPGTVVNVSWYPANMMQMRAVIWDSDPHEVYFLPRELLVEYKTEQEKLEELALSLGFPQPPKKDEERYFAKLSEWKRNLRNWSDNVRKLAREEKNDDAS